VGSKSKCNSRQQERQQEEQQGQVQQGPDGRGLIDGRVKNIVYDEVFL
jgi:hypothetical protein